MALRDLPSVDQLVRSLDEQGLPRLLIVETARSAIEDARNSGTDDPRSIASGMLERLRSLRHRSVINATGVLLHTNLGRAPLAPAAADALRATAVTYGNLEFDLIRGRRGGRGAYLQHLIAKITGAEAALVVNNNAGALLVALAALGTRRPVAVSRGELIEIGGSYRLPELMAASGARMLEVGTTNRTHLSDYERAVAEGAGLVLRVHPSNYRVVGFADSPSLEALVTLAHHNDLSLVFDVGSGLLDANAPWLAGPPPRWLEGEPGIRQVLDTGADLVTFSGDKLLGGPQAGVVVGRADLVSELAHHPIARALRTSGPVIAALTETFEMYANGEGGAIPFWSMASTTYEELEARCRAVLSASDAEGEIIAGASVPGAGSVPGAEVPSPLIRVSTPSAATLWPRLLESDPPVVARREAGRVLVDLRSVSPDDDLRVASLLGAACRS
jgi:L-seryl-tRNA(Ser) seleniumtransferase